MLLEDERSHFAAEDVLLGLLMLRNRRNAAAAALRWAAFLIFYRYTKRYRIGCGFVGLYADFADARGSVSYLVGDATLMLWCPFLIVFVMVFSVVVVLDLHRRRSFVVADHDDFLVVAGVFSLRLFFPVDRR